MISRRFCSLMMVLGSFWIRKEKYLEVSHFLAFVGRIVVDLTDLSNFSVIFSVFVRAEQDVERQQWWVLFAFFVVRFKNLSLGLVASCAKTERWSLDASAVPMALFFVIGLLPVGVFCLYVVWERFYKLVFGSFDGVFCLK